MTTFTQITENYRIQHAFDGKFYPMVRDGDDFEYIWQENGAEESFPNEDEARAFLASHYGALA